MKTSKRNMGPRRIRGDRGYLIVLFVIIVAFVGVVASMQVLILTSVGTTSRAYDGYRQGAAEISRLEHAVTEAVLTTRQISVAPASPALAEVLNAEIGHISAGGATITATVVPATLPTISTFPNVGEPPDELTVPPAEVQAFLTPELGDLIGPRIATYPEQQFEFSSQRVVLGIPRTYHTGIRARLLAAPLTRFAIVAYDLPAEIGTTSARTATPPSMCPAGLVPGRDVAFVTDLQASAGVLPYHYRRRAVVAAAYQYLFSQSFIDRVSEYAGITHYHSLDISGSAVLGGMMQIGPATTWDLGVAGAGTYHTITMTRDAAVIFTEQSGHTLRLFDSVGDAGSPALFLLILGPSDAGIGPLTVELSSITRPIVIVACNIRVVAAPGVAVNGALFLDPASAIAPSGTLTVGHVSFWAGSISIPENALAAGPLSLAAEAIAPRVVYVATVANRL